MNTYYRVKIAGKPAFRPCGNYRDAFKEAIERIVGHSPQLDRANLPVIVIQKSVHDAAGKLHWVGHVYLRVAAILEALSNCEEVISDFA
jgi:hypothetical protein